MVHTLSFLQIQTGPRPSPQSLTPFVVTSPTAEVRPKSVPEFDREKQME
jgi:hypothetical protein